MAGLFGMGNWEKPGPGVLKDAPKPKGLFQFFVLFGRKFWKMVSLNMLYILLSIPQLILIYAVFSYFISSMLSDTVDGIPADAWVWAVNAIAFGFASIWVMFCGTGPTSAGLTYILRNFSEENHAWIWSDMKDKIKENFLQGLIVFLVDLVILILSGVAIIFYGQFFKGLFGVFLQAFMVICLFIYTIMHWYIYPLMIGYKVKTYHLYTNAFVLTLAKLPINLGMFILLSAFLVIYHLIAAAFWPLITLTPVIMISFIAFAWVFFAWRVLKKNVNPEEGVVKQYEV